MQKVTLREMFEAGVHFGHQTRYWNPKMAPYIFGSKQKIHIIDLDKSLPLFQEALKFVSQVAAKNGKILFVATKKAAQEIICEEAKRCGMPYINHRWLGGTLTNHKTIRQSRNHFRDLEMLRDSGKLENFTKKEALGITREIAKMERNLGGLRTLGGLPDAIFVIDVGHEKIAVSEANKLSIPVIGVVDTNHDPKSIDYVIPGNDDAIRAIKFYATHMADAIIEARKDIVEAQRIAEQSAERTIRKEIRPKQQVQAKKVITKTEHEVTPDASKKEHKAKEAQHELAHEKKTHKEPVIKIAEKEEVIADEAKTKPKKKPATKPVVKKTTTKKKAPAKAVKKGGSK